jgi:hypothetical protein
MERVMANELEIGSRMPDGTVYAGLSPENGKPMYTTPEDAPGLYNYFDAQAYAKNLDAHGYKDWRRPSRSELNVLFNNRAAIGGFIEDESPQDIGSYWSSSLSYNSLGWAQRFGDGRQTPYNVFRYERALSLRCVRGWNG